MNDRRVFAAEPRRSRMAGVISLLIHLGLAVVLFQVMRRAMPGSQPPASHLIVLQAAGDPTEHPMDFGPSARPAEAPAASPSDEVVPRVVGGGSGDRPGPRLRTPIAPIDAGPDPLELAPNYVSGQLWIPPLPLTREEIAGRLGRFTALAKVMGPGGGSDGVGGDGGGGGGGDAGQALHARRLDSAVTAIVQSYLDSVAADPTLETPTLPAWVAEVGGLEFGLDQQWIYFAGLRIPTVLLALFVPNEGGNYFANKREAWMMEARREIYYAAWMADTREEFDENVRKLRERKQREREFARNQRSPMLIEDSVRAAPGGGGQ